MDLRSAESRLSHIAEVSRNARTTWFGLLAALLFCGVTLLDVRDRDFFEYGAATQLPLINVEVPVVGFFVTAPLLVLSLYAYLHIYLMKLWRALAPMPRHVGGVALDDAVYPWLLSDAAIRLKTGRRRDFGWLTAFVGWGLGWAFAPLVIGAFWVRSWPYHHEGLTFGIGTLFLISLGIWVRSRWRRRDWLLRKGEAPSASPVAALRWLGRGVFGVTVLSTAVLSWETTEGNLDCPLSYREDRHWGDVASPDPSNLKQFVACRLRYGGRSAMLAPEFHKVGWLEALHALRPYETLHGWLLSAAASVGFGAEAEKVLGARLEHWSAPLLYKAQLYRAEIVQRPSGWVGYERAWDAYRRKYREDTIQDIKRGDIQVEEPYRHLRRKADNPSKIPTDAEIEATLRRDFGKARGEAVAELEKPDRRGADLRRADLREAYLPGLDLRAARMEGANLILARMEGANLRYARMEGANLTAARMEGADLRWARMEGADLRRANIIDGRLQSPSIISADASQVRNLTQAMLETSFGDATTRIPPAVIREEPDGAYRPGRTIHDRLTRPDHWATDEIPRAQWYARWRQWRIEHMGEDPDWIPEREPD